MFVLHWHWFVAVRHVEPAGQVDVPQGIVAPPQKGSWFEQGAEGAQRYAVPPQVVAVQGSPVQSTF
jgi:hypothetical protein